jgi:hypothetical protein
LSWTEPAKRTFRHAPARASPMVYVMSVSILVCGCGMKIRAPGATPGRIGRCPSCGGELRVPDFLPPDEPTRARTADDASPGAGYGLNPNKERVLSKKKGRAEPSDITPPRTGSVERKSALPMAGGILPVLDKPETSGFASFLYPLRSADSVAVIASLTVILWLFTIVVPEYCIGVMGDADDMGTPTIGKLIALISILPVAFLLPFAMIYWLQYLGRVVVSSGMGETIPPRTPDRNFDGFFNGLSPWIIWLFLGVAVGMLPAAIYRLLSSSESVGGLLPALALVFVCLPYVLMALLLTFLHDDPLAAKPLGVVTALLQLGGSFLLVSVFVGFVIAGGAGAFVLALLLRSGHFVLYLLACVGCWTIVIWLSIVVMRVLGNHYHRYRQVLHWNRERPRWGVAWKL